MQPTPEIPSLSHLVRATRAGSDAHGLVRSLTDEVGPRYPCTPGDVAGVAWAREAMTRAGLTSVRAEPAPATLWERGAEAGALLLPREQPVVLSALGGCVGTDGKRLEAEVVGFASLDELDAAPAGSLEGKIAYLHHVMPRLRDGTGYNQGSRARMLGPSKAAARGAAAFLVRSVGTSTARVAHTGALWYDPAAPSIPAAALSTPDADLLQRALLAGKRPRFALTLGSHELPVGMSNNVIGELPGTDAADEIVLIGAHLDSWELGTGALDDGAGCAAVLEAARMIAALPVRPRRTLRVVLFANEELGTGGGRAYATDHAAEAPRHVAALEIDQGDGRPWALRVPAGERDTPHARALHAALEPLGIALDEGPSRGGVDIGPLAALGVPFVDLRQDATRYFDVHHTLNDVFENVSRDDLEATTVAVAAATWALLQAPERFTHRPR